MYATVRLGGFPGARADDRLRRVKSRQVGIAAGIFADAGGEMMRARARKLRALSSSLQTYLHQK